ncbi:AMP-binding protein [Pigmentiphaga sp. CHJ604]|uniref:AMP-binding protein n=1 Tax=Pigmentiphaga sp. CHJ604 TaxID=3081984 RepID=UPI0030D2C394
MKIDDFFARLAVHAGQDRRPAIVGTGGSHLSYSDLIARVDSTAQRLRDAGVRVLATVLDNGPSWIVADLATLRAGVVHVPLPGFFTPAMQALALEVSGADALASTRESAPPAGFDAAVPIGPDLALFQRDVRSVTMPPGTVKITFTSGSTGQPKGVCLSGIQMLEVARGLAQAVEGLAIERHLNTLPFPVLLENIAGVQAPLWQGASCVALPLDAIGLSGSSSFSPGTYLQTLQAYQPHSIILLPQMLRAITATLAGARLRAPASLRLAAVGGAAVGRVLLRQAHAAGLPAYEGYGLSEGASVQTLNLPHAHRPGSAGRPLPHARVRTTADGEIEICGSVFAGYLGQAHEPPQWWPTGDLGRLDEEGYLHVHGRKKHVLITSFGRNVSPEWVETELRAEPAILQAVVLGEGRPTLGAVLWPLHPGVDDTRIRHAIEQANARLPDYARIGAWCRADTPFDADSGLATANGRPRREAVAALYEHRLFADPNASPAFDAQPKR